MDVRVNHREPPQIQTFVSMPKPREPGALPSNTSFRYGAVCQFSSKVVFWLCPRKFAASKLKPRKASL